MARKVDVPTDPVYPCDKSYMPKNVPLDKNSPVRTLNKGTKEYEELGIDALVKELDLPGLIKKFQPSADDTNKNQGNYQKNFGITSGKNVGAPNTEADILHFSGCTIPRMNKNQDDPELNRAFEIAWKIGKIMGIDYCQDDYLEKNP